MVKQEISYYILILHTKVQILWCRKYVKHDVTITRFRKECNYIFLTVNYFIYDNSTLRNLEQYVNVERNLENIIH